MSGRARKRGYIALKTFQAGYPGAPGSGRKEELEILIKPVVKTEPQNVGKIEISPTSPDVPHQTSPDVPVQNKN